MKKMFLATLLVASTAFAQASEVTVLSTEIPATRGFTSVDTKFYIDTDMKEAYAKVHVQEQFTVYVRNCSYGPGYPYPYPYPGQYCNTFPQTQYRTIMTDKVKIEGMTMNGDDVIYQGAEGDVVCGKMGRSRIFKVPTFYLSGKCDLDGKIVRENGVNKLTVKFITK
ncbi:MAG: hypothetical protein ACLGHN_12350 [Bacteriovoracia bacterium]